jgi:hypothetical protein
MYCMLNTFPNYHFSESFTNGVILTLKADMKMMKEE